MHATVALLARTRIGRTPWRGANMSPKRGPLNYYKGKAARSTGMITSKGPCVWRAKCSFCV